MPVVRTGPLPSSARTTTLSADVDKHGKVTGTAAPGTRIEVANLSTAPTGHLLPHDVVEVAVADANGQFSFQLAAALGGDVLQLQTRVSATDPVLSTVQLRVDANDRDSDPRAAFVSVKRLRVEVDAGHAGALLISARTNLPLCEPDAVLRFTNKRTGAAVDVVVDPLGRIPATALVGRIGDSIDVAVTDDIASSAPSSAGSLVVELRAVASPSPVAKDRSASLVVIPGRLFLEQLAIGRVGLAKQGGIGDCPVPAGASAIAAADPSAIRELIRDRGDGTYAVTFHPPGDTAKEIVVDGKLFTRGGSSPIYGTGVQRGGETELWFPLVEKAYAELVGGYDVLEKGTSVGKVMADFTGRANTEVWLKDANVDDVWQKMQRARTHGQAMACGTYPSSESARYRGTGLYANHAYSVLGLEERDGKRLVTMRNPWGGAAGFSGDFQLRIEDFVALYQVLNVC